MEEVYEELRPVTSKIIRRAKFLAALLERKKLYIDDNLFVGSMAGSVQRRSTPIPNGTSYG
jgi:trans-4-hydroxy-L-proline dehydratase